MRERRGRQLPVPHQGRTVSLVTLPESLRRRENNVPAADRPLIANKSSPHREMQYNGTHPTSAHIANHLQLEFSRLNALPSAPMVDSTSFCEVVRSQMSGGCVDPKRNRIAAFLCHNQTHPYERTFLEGFLMAKQGNSAASNLSFLGTVFS